MVNNLNPNSNPNHNTNSNTNSESNAPLIQSQKIMGEFMKCMKKTKSRENIEFNLDNPVPRCPEEFDQIICWEETPEDSWA